MKGKTLWLMVICLVVAGLLLVSCAPAPKPAPAPPPTPTPAPAPKPTPAEKEVVAPAAKEPQYGGTLTVLHAHAGLEPQTWDPADQNWIVEPFVSPYMEHLAVGNFEEKGPRGTNEYVFTDMEFVPAEFLKGCLAERWELTDDKTVVYRIRKGVIFPARPGVMDSREMTAEDVAYCFNRSYMDNPKSSAIDRPYYESITATDKYTVVVKLKSYYANWMLPFAWGYYTTIYPREAVKAGIYDWKKAVGTGPFILQDYVSGATLTYVKNPQYWGTTVINGKEYKLPFVDRLIWPIIVDESTRLAALRTGKADTNESVSWKYKESLQQTNPELVRYRYISTTFGAICGRMDTKPFDDIRVRKALSMAIDRKAMMTSLMGGEAVLFSSPYSISWPKDLYTPLEELPESARELFEYNPEKAKQLLTEAGYPKGFKSEMVISSPGMVDAASMLVDYWKKHLGIEVELKPYDYTTYITIQYKKSHKALFYMSKGNGDPYAVLSAICRPGSTWNPAIWDDKYYVDTYVKSRSTSNIAEAKKTLKGLNVYVVDQCPYIILPVSYVYAYAWPWIKNWYGELNTNVRTPGQIHARIWLDRDLRAKMTGKR